MENIPPVLTPMIHDTCCKKRSSARGLGEDRLLVSKLPTSSGHIYKYVHRTSGCSVPPAVVLNFVFLSSTTAVLFEEILTKWLR